MGNYEETSNRGWYVGLLVVTGALYVAALAIVVCSYIFYTHKEGGIYGPLCRRPIE